MKKYITPQNIVIGCLVIGVFLMGYILFTRNVRPESPEVLKTLQNQQKELETLRKEKEQENKESMLRDSILWEQLRENDKSRANQLQNIQRSRNEKVDRINSADFTADSIRRAFAEN